MKTFLALLMLTVGFTAFAADAERSVRSIDVPKYPPLACQARIEGTVRLNIVVSAAGQVTNVTVISGPGLLQAAASENVKSWHFAPAPGQNPSEIDTTYVYKIEGKEIAYVEPDKQRSRVNLDLPGQVEVSGPPMKLENVVADQK